MLPTSVTLRDGRTALLRRATPDDAGAITDLVNLVGSERQYVLREAADWTLEEERATLARAQDPESAFFLAEVRGRASALANVSRGRHPKQRQWAEFGISCHPDCRRVGLGSAMLTVVIDWARSVKIQKLGLEVFASNEPAIALYRKAGFVEDGRRRAQYFIEGRSVDGLFMALWL